MHFFFFFRGMVEISINNEQFNITRPEVISEICVALDEIFKRVSMNNMTEPAIFNLEIIHFLINTLMTHFFIIHYFCLLQNLSKDELRAVELNSDVIVGKYFENTRNNI